MYVLFHLFHFQSFVETSWSEYYEEVPDTVKTNLTADQHIDVFGNIWVCNCKFSVLDHSGNGAAICKSLSSGISNMLIEFSIFQECTTAKSEGGAIYFNKGQCVIASSCGYKCIAGYGYPGEFSRILVSSGSKNYIIDSSITKAKTEIGEVTLYHAFGNFLCKGVNVSNNELYLYSGIRIWDPSTSLISFSSFRNNNATNGGCIDFYSGSHQMKNTNIIENNQLGSQYGIIFARNIANLTMNHCSVYDKSQTVFCAATGSSIICDDCSMADDQKTITSGSVIINKLSGSFINSYEYLNLGDCQTEIAIRDDINPVPVTSVALRRFTWYCDGIHRPDDISFYRLLQYELLLCCLHPNPSKDIWYDIQ